MDVLKGMNAALQYIEQNLTEPIDLKEVAKRAYCSEYHFKRLFGLLAGITISEYIRRRKLTEAALELKEKEVKVIDLALKYGYQSPDAFSRAFQNFHGVTPTEAKQAETSLKAYPRMSFQLTIQGGSEMKYRIVEKEAFQVVGVKYDVEMVNEVLHPTYERMIEAIAEETINELAAMADQREFPGMVHASTDYKEDAEGKATFQQYIGVVTAREGNGYEQLHIPARQWAIFEMEGDWEAVEKQWMQIYSEWLPSSAYELAVGPELLVNKAQTNEVWLPIQKR